LIRKLVKAARTEQDLEEERLQGAFAEELRAAKARAAASQHPNPVAVVPPAPDLAPAAPPVETDTRTANQAHLPFVADLARQRDAEVLWVRSNADHVVWCERRHPEPGASREVICVARIKEGAIVDQWSFG
jgi:hypothetical protein